MSESLEQSQKNRQLDKDYINNTWKWYRDAKETKMGFYWDFNNTKSENKNPEKDNFDFEWESEIFKQNSKYIPIIDRLFKINKISENTRNSLFWQNLEKPNLEKIEWITKEEKEIINNSFKKIESTNKKSNLETLQKDIKLLKNKEYLNSFNLEIKDWKYESEVLNMIWWNYIEFPTIENKKEIEEDLKVAITLTKNEIERKYTNLSRDSESYNTAIKNIDSDDLKKQMQWIESLYILWSSKAWELWKTRVVLDRHIEKRKNELIEEFKKLHTELKKLNENSEQNKEKIKNIKEEIKNISDEANEIEAWDIFEASEIEIVTWKKED